MTSTYEGDGSFATSDSSPLTQTVTPADTNTSVMTLKSPTVFGESVTFTATVTSTQGVPTGTVTFKDGVTTLGTGSLSAGQALLSTSALSVSSHNITAEYGASANFNPSASSVITQVVNKADTTTTITFDQPDPSMPAQWVTIHFTVSAVIPGAGTPTGDVTITVNDSSGSTCTATVAVGTCTIRLSSAGFWTLTATYAGDANFNGSAGNESHQVTPVKFYLPAIFR